MLLFFAIKNVDSLRYLGVSYLTEKILNVGVRNILFSSMLQREESVTILGSVKRNVSEYFPAS